MKDEKVLVRVLGSGTSTGVPLIGCRCPVCTSSDPRDARMRAGVQVVAPDGFSLQIDVSPDFRQQALRFAVARVDAVLLTHCHADHVLGLDDIRRYNTLQRRDVPLYARRETLSGVTRIFDYIAHPTPLAESLGMYRPHIDFCEVGDAALSVGPFAVRTREVPHGPCRSTAVEVSFQGRRFVLASDCSDVTPELAAMLHGADVAMLDGLRDRPHASHLTFERAVRALVQAEPRVARLVHIGHDVAHRDLVARYAPFHVAPTFDGETLLF